MHNTKIDFEEIVPDSGVGEPARLELVSETVEAVLAQASHSLRLIDFGCGTGRYLTIPLARMYPNLEIIAFDPHKPSLEVLKKLADDEGITNIIVKDTMSEVEDADIVILSEVIEHVYDPQSLLKQARSYVIPRNGRIVVTCPNGYGVGELTSFFYLIVYRVTRLRAGEFLSNRRDKGSFLASSGHVQFYTLRSLDRLFAVSGLSAVAQRSRAFVCGYGLNGLMRLLKLTFINRRLAKFMPMPVNSCWMFVLEVRSEQSEGDWNTSNGAFHRLRRRLNEYRYKEHFE